MKKLMKWLVVIAIPCLIILNWNHFSMITKLLILAALMVIVPTMVFYSKLLLEKKMKQITQQQRKAEIKSMEQKIDELYESERMGYYQDAHYLFHQLMQNGKLKRNEILKIKHMINAALGSYTQDYKDKHFKNDAHEIYSKMKNKHIDEKDWSTIINYLQTR